MIKETTGRWGQISYFAKDIYVGKSIHSYGEFSPDETEFILSIANKEKLCIDVGANIGCISQALLHEGHQVVAFEPQPKVFSLLVKNCPKAVNYNVALGSTNGSISMPKVYYSDKGNFGGISVNSKSMYGEYDVELRTLDSYGFLNVGLIKIDVEGFEEQVLHGAVNTIHSSRPIMYIEDDRQENSVSLRKFIKSLGYSIEEHRPLLFREKNFFNNRKNVWDKLYVSHNLICRPD